MAGALTKAQLVTQNQQLLGTIQSGANLLTQANRLNSASQHQIDALKFQVTSAVGVAGTVALGWLTTWLTSSTAPAPSLNPSKVQAPASNKNATATIVTLLQPDPRTAQELLEAHKQLNVSAEQFKTCSMLRHACEGQATQVTADKAAAYALLKACEGQVTQLTDAQTASASALKGFEGQVEQLTADKATAVTGYQGQIDQLTSALKGSQGQVAQLTDEQTASANALKGCEGEKSQLITDAAATKTKTKTLFENFKAAQEEVEKESTHNFQKWEECLDNLNKFASKQKA